MEKYTTNAADIKTGYKYGNYWPDTVMSVLAKSKHFILAEVVTVDNLVKYQIFNNCSYNKFHDERENAWLPDISSTDKEEMLKIYKSKAEMDPEVFKYIYEVDA